MVKQKIVVDVPVYKIFIEKIPCVRYSDVIPEDKRERLKKFMIGQTAPFIDTLPIEEQDYIYLDDYLNFLYKEKTGKEKFWD